MYKEIKRRVLFFRDRLYDDYVNWGSKFSDSKIDAKAYGLIYFWSLAIPADISNLMHFVFYGECSH